MGKERKICAIIDAQGFWVDKTFYVREIGIYNQDYQISLEVIQDFDKEFRIKNFKTISFQQYQIHGIPLDDVLNKSTKKTVSATNLKAVIEGIYYRIRTPEKYLFGVKNQHMSKLLEDYQIPFFDFENELVGGECCPSVRNFDRYQIPVFCLLHASIKTNICEKNYRCALRKVGNIWNWVTSKNSADLLLEELEHVINI